jgi:cysteine desulfurase
VSVVDGGPVTYLDHAASAPLRPEVAEAMAPFAGVRYGNATGSHRRARDVRRALEEARDEIAAHLGGRPDEVVFTSGGTESANLAVLGVLAARSRDFARRTGAPVAPGALCVVRSAVEHPCVLEACRAAADGRAAVQGVAAVTVREAPVDATGRLDLGSLPALLGPGADGAEVVLVAVMAANNEVGTVQPVAETVSLARRHAPGAAVFSDAVQAAALGDLAERCGAADLVSVSAHKIGGPGGVGALRVRRGVAIAPVLHGGGQEHGRRSGTHHVAGAVGLAAALGAVAGERHREAARLRVLGDRLSAGLAAATDGARPTVPREVALPGHCHLVFDGVEREELLVLLDDAGVCASAGSSCASGATEPSHVLAAMGVPPREARGAVRFSLGHTTTDADVDRALSVVPAAVARLRTLAA